MINQIVDRCHVGQSYLAVIRYFRSRLVRGSWRKLSRGQRRQMLYAVIERHCENRKVYGAVMGGGL